MKLNDIYTLNIKNTDYHCVISRISKSEAIKLLQSIDLTKKSGTLQNLLKLNIRSNFEAVNLFQILI